MAREKDVVYKFKNFQDEILKILKDTEKERDKYKDKVEGLLASCDAVNEELAFEQKDNIAYRETIEDLKRKNKDLEDQIKILEADRQKLLEQLNTSGKKNISGHVNNEDKATEVQDIVNLNQKVELNQEMKCSVNRKEQEDTDMEVNDEIASLQDYTFSTQFSPIRKVNETYDEFFNDDSPSLFDNIVTPVVHKNGKDVIQKAGEKDKREESKLMPEVSKGCKIEKPQLKLMIPETVESMNENFIIDSENEKTPEKKAIPSLEKSPVLKEQSGKKRKNSIASLEVNENGNTKSPIRVVDAKYLLKPKNTALCGMSPAKRPAMEDFDIFNSPVKFKSPIRNKTTPKKTPKKLTLQTTPKKSPRRLSQLKKSHLIDAEKTFAGMKKLTQTKLNLNIFSNKKRNEKENQTEAKKSDLKDKLRPSYEYMSQTKKDDEDDDLIHGSPQIKSKSLTDLAQPKPGGSKLNSQPSESLLYDDPEATYVSSLFIKNWKPNQKFDDIPEEKPPTPQKELSPTERIPDRNPDSPPFPYKREAVRKKADRKKLPGHVCYQCEQYYRSVYGNNLNEKEYQQMLNRCSRHRDKYPDIDNTPPGFWKPYLTMTESPEHY